MPEVPVPQENPTFTRLRQQYGVQIDRLFGPEFFGVENIKVAFTREGWFPEATVNQRDRQKVVEDGLRQITSRAELLDIPVAERDRTAMAAIETVIKGDNPHSWSQVFGENSFGSTSSLEGDQEIKTVFRQLLTYFSAEDISTLAFVFGVDHDALPGENKKAYGLAYEMIRQGRLSELQARIYRDRPHLRPPLTTDTSDVRPSVHYGSGQAPQKPTSNEAGPSSTDTGRKRMSGREIADSANKLHTEISNMTVEQLLNKMTALGLDPDDIDYTPGLSPADMVNRIFPVMHTVWRGGDHASHRGSFAKPSSTHPRVEAPTTPITTETQLTAILLKDYLGLVLNDDELRALCAFYKPTHRFLDYESLSGDNTAAKIRELTAALDRRNLLPQIGPTLMRGHGSDMEELRRLTNDISDARNVWTAAVDTTPPDQRRDKLTAFSRTYALKIGQLANTAEEPWRTLYRHRATVLENIDFGSSQSSHVINLFMLAVRQAASDPTTGKLFFEAATDEGLMTDQLLEAYNNIKSKYPRYF